MFMFNVLVFQFNNLFNKTSSNDESSMPSTLHDFIVRLFVLDHDMKSVHDCLSNCQSQARLKPKRCLVGFIFTLEIIIIIKILESWANPSKFKRNRWFFLSRLPFFLLFFEVVFHLIRPRWVHTQIFLPLGHPFLGEFK